MSSLLCCYFPTKVVFVDDDEGVLKSINSSIDHKAANYDFFTNPYEALKLINSSIPTDFIVSRDDSTEAKVYDVYKAMYNPKRHDQVSTVIVDYQMPTMNGLEFLEKITNPYVQRVLYTGIADESIAIEAFNKGIIHGYIKKQDTNREKVINDSIQANQLEYFKKLTGILVGSAFKELIAEKNEQTGFYDPVFIRYFEEQMKKHDICEYYLNEPVGGFICLSRKGELSTFYAYTAETLKHNRLSYAILEDIADLDSSEYADLMKQIESNQKIMCLPFYGNYSSSNINSDNWKNFIKPLEKIEGQHLYYVAYASHPGAEKDTNIYSFDQSKKDRLKG